MKYMLSLSWKPENAAKISERFMKWKAPEGWTWITPSYTLLGLNRNVCIIEANAEALAQGDRDWRDLGVFKAIPVMESSEMVKIKPSV